MILEGIVTTVSPDGVLNIAPMGPHVGDSMDRFVLRPFQTAQTYRNLKSHGEGVLHVTDDVLLLARAALGRLDPVPAVEPAERVRGYVLRDTCRYYEFRVVAIDDRAERVTIEAQTVHCGRAATSSASTGPSMPWSRRRSWRHASPSCRPRRLPRSFAGSRCWCRKPAVPRSTRRSAS